MLIHLTCISNMSFRGTVREEIVVWAINKRSDIKAPARLNCSIDVTMPCFPEIGVLEAI